MSASNNQSPTSSVISKGKVKGGRPPRTKPKTELVAVATALDTAAESPPSCDDILPLDACELDRKLAQLHRDHREITTSIQSFRIRLRDGQINASATHSCSGLRT